MEPVSIGALTCSEITAHKALGLINNLPSSHCIVQHYPLDYTPRALRSTFEHSPASSQLSTSLHYLNCCHAQFQKPILKSSLI